MYLQQFQLSHFSKMLNMSSRIPFNTLYLPIIHPLAFPIHAQS
nr:MAG TPA: hypothetical protein [Caudoviricetes sp.]